MNIKQSLLAICITTLLLVLGCLTAWAATADSALIDFDFEENILYADVTTEADRTVTVSILKKGFNNLTLDNYKFATLSMDVGVTDTDGKLRLICKISGNVESGYYILMFTGIDVENAELYIASEQEKSEMLHYFNELTSRTVSENIEQFRRYAKILFFDIDGIYSLIEDKTGVYNIISENDYQKLSDIKPVFDHAVLQVFKSEALRYVNQATLSNMEAVIKKYNPVLSLDITNNLYIKNKEVFHKQILGKNFDTIIQIQESFRKGASVVNVNNAVNSTIAKVLEDEKDNIKFKFTVSSLNAEEKVVLYSALIKQDFDSIEEIVQAGENAVDSYRNSVKTPAKQTSGGGGAGSRVTMAADAQDVLAKPEVKMPEIITFSDLESVPWAEKEIIDFASKGYISGKGDGRFYPNDYITREEFVKIIIEAYGLVMKDAKTNFTDVPEDAWYYRHIATAQKIGLVKGDMNGHFGVGRLITREEMAVISYRMIKYLNLKMNIKQNIQAFADEDRISQYAVFDVNIMHKAGIINGKGNGMFEPYSFTTRAESVIVISRITSLEKLTQ